MKTAYALCWTPDGISLCVVVKISVALLLFLVSVYILPFVHKRKNIREFGVEPLLLRMEEVEEESQVMNTTAYILLTVGLVTTLLLVILIFSIVNAKMTGTCCFKANSKVWKWNIGSCFV